MRKIVVAALVAAMAASASFVAGPAAAADAPAAAATGYSVETTDLGTLLDDPAAKAVLDKHLPGLSGNAQIQMARSLTLKTLQQFAADMLPDAKLDDVQRDFDKLPKK